MRVAVCVRAGLDGELGPFDAAAYEAALRIEGAEVILLSMGPPSVAELLLRLTRLGASEAVLLSDKAFAGADTLATAYALSLAIRRLAPSLVLCGRQTLIGDTGQTPVMLSEMLRYGVVTGAMGIDEVTEKTITCTTRSEGSVSATLPAVVAVERIHTLRFPRLRAKERKLTVWSAEDVGADLSRCGLRGSPTVVLSTSENEAGKRHCTFLARDKLAFAIEEGLKRAALRGAEPALPPCDRLPKAISVGEGPLSLAVNAFAEVKVIELSETDEVIAWIESEDPDAVLFGSDARAKRVAAEVAARMGLGLCADCTAISAEDGMTVMVRPALSGSIMARVKSRVRPALATVRSEETTDSRIMVCAGYGVRNSLERVKTLCEQLGAELCASLRMVDDGYAEYEFQVGLTGRTVSPPVYIALGVSGAVHHIVGMARAGTVIAVNTDKDAPIFEYADFGIIDEF